MIRTLPHIALAAAVTFAMVALPACIQENVEDLPDNGKENNMANYLSLNLSLDATDTRGGIDEDPEGRLPASEAENAIKDLTLFFLPTPDNLSISSDIAFSGTLHIDFDNINPDYEITHSPQDPFSKTILIRLDDDMIVDNGAWSIISVANCGDLSDVRTLNNLRKIITGKAWMTTDESIATDFVMSSFNDEKGGVISPIEGEGRHNGTKADPYRGECSLMRIAARIDLCCNDEKSAGGSPASFGIMTSGNEIAYEIMEDGDKTATAYLTGVRIVNSMSRASYLMRHSADASGISSLDPDQVPLNLDCGGLLTTDNENRQTQYVVDPLFFNKKSDTSPLTLSEWFGDTTPRSLRENHSDPSFMNGCGVSDFIKGSATSDPRFNTTLTVGYVNENTYPAGLDPECFATGLLIKAVFFPTTVYKAIPDKNDDDCIDHDYRRGEDFWVWTPGNDGGYSSPRFFSDADVAYIFATRNGGTVTKHPGGISYYHIWIRHAAPTVPEDSDVMLNAIVRNNIYRVLLRFSGPGDDIPFKTEPEDVTWTILSRPWNLRWQPEIII